MIIESIFLAIFIISLGGILFILIRKIPVLVKLPQNGSTGFKENQLVSSIEQKLQKIFIFFGKQIFLHKFLSWVKCLTIKVEVKIDHILHSIRKKAQQIDRDLKEKK